jgi:hypothetical protein
LKDRRIQCENSIDRMWSLFLFFENEPMAKQHLFQSYSLILDEKEANRLAFENTHKFIYFLKQGTAYFNSAKKSDLIVRPLLVYYGITSLMKSILLLKDPHYPKTTSVLQHGITTRKKKKSNYNFQDDEIKVQKDGLLPYFSQIVINDPLLTHRKYKVLDLFSMIPELQDSYFLLFKSRTMTGIRVTKLNSSSWMITFEKRQVDDNNLVFSELLSLFEHGLSLDEEIQSSSDAELSLTVRTSNPSFIPDKNHAQIVRDYKGGYHFYFRESLALSNEIIVFNMLLYLLGMLCRYDTELWGELIFSFSSGDIYIIEEILQLSLRKFPNLILNHLFNETILFES